MPLFINGAIMDKLHSDTRAFLDAYPSLKEYSRRLLPLPHKTVSPIGSLCVIQREFAIVAPNDPSINIVGTPDATTCSIVVLRHSGTGVVALGHFDGSDTERGIQEMIHKVQEYSSSVNGEIELHMVGGFNDSKGYSTELCLSILYCFNRQPVNIHLVTACICELNTFVRSNVNLPVIHGLAVNVKSGDIFPANFADKGPDLALRSSRLLYPGSPEMLNVYESYYGVLKIGPFCYQPVRCIDDWIKFDDDIILKCLSTSPEAESPDYVRETRQALQFIKKHPFPSITVFSNGSRFYRKDEYGQWTNSA